MRVSLLVRLLPNRPFYILSDLCRGNAFRANRFYKHHAVTVYTVRRL